MTRWRSGSPWAWGLGGSRQTARWAGASGRGRPRPRAGSQAASARRVVKEEISADNARLPCFNGRVVSWVSPATAAGALGRGGPSVAAGARGEAGHRDPLPRGRGLEAAGLPRAAALLRSWSWPRVPTRMRGPRPLTDTQTCPHLWSGWAASGTPGPLLSSKSSGVPSLVVLRGPCQGLLRGGQLSRDPQSVGAGQQRRSGQGGPGWAGGRRTRALGRQAPPGWGRGAERTSGTGSGLPSPCLSRRHSPNVASSRDGMDNETGTESMVSHRRERARRRNREEGTGCTPAPLTPARGVSGEGSQDPSRTPATPVTRPLPGQQVLEDGRTAQVASLSVVPQLPGPMGTRGGTGGGTWGCPPIVRPPC